MEEKINEIIEQAKNMRKNPQISDYKIAEYVHIELGKIVYYDNNYTAKLDRNKEETKISAVRKNKLLKSKVNKSSKAQICKGMAEIYAEILNKVGIEARAIGVKRKGEKQEVSEEEAKHYCAVFKIDGKEYIQDYLMEASLMRIKIGEVDYKEKIPGICAIEDYSERGTKSLAKIELSHEFLEKILGENIDNLNDKDILNIIFNKLNDYFTNENNYFGFEEAKDFIFLTAKNFINNKSGIKIVNLVKESENECGVACIYEIEGQKFLVRGGAQSSDLSFPLGKITEKDLKQIQEQGYEGRSMEEETYLQLNQVKQNNKQINRLIEQILKERREQRIPIEKNGIIDSKIEKLLQHEVRKCLEIYKLEFPGYTCQGRDTVSFREPKETADCYGGTLGLQVTYGMQEFIDEKILPVISKMGYRIDGNGEPAFDETFRNNSEHSSNPEVKSFSKYIGSTKDQMDYFTLLLAKNGVDLDFIWDALAHEEMHTFGVSNGNTFLKEGTTEELTREICEKYNIHMSPHAHTQEANFVRKLEMLVGRDIVIESGMWTGRFKEQEFKGILEDNPELKYSELSEMFELLKSEPQKLSKEETDELNEFCSSNPKVAEKLKNSVEKYRIFEKQNQRYSKIAERFDSELGMQEGSFYKYIEILDNMYALSQRYKQDPKLYRDIYNLPLDELENGYMVFQTHKGFNPKDMTILAKIRTLFDELSEMNPSMEINSYNDLMAPIDEKIVGRDHSVNDEYKEYSSVLSIQEDEITDLMEICNEYGINIEDKSEEKGKNALEDCMEDDRLRISTEQVATRIVKTAVQGRDENSREEENNIGD